MTRQKQAPLLPAGAGNQFQNPRTVRRDVRRYVEHSNDETGKQLTIERIDEEGEKNFNDLVRDARRKDIIMEIAAEPDVNGVRNRLLKVAFKLEAFLFAGPYVLLEDGRFFIRTGRYIPTNEFRGIRGTKPRGKGYLEAMADEIKQETRLIVQPNRLVAIQDKLRMQPLNRAHWRDSTVYAGVLAVDIPHYYFAAISETKWKTRISRPDGGVRVHFSWKHWDQIDKTSEAFRKKMPEDLSLLPVHQNVHAA